MSIRSSFKSAVDWLKDTISPPRPDNSNPWQAELSCKANSDDKNSYAVLTFQENEGCVSIYKTPVTTRSSMCYGHYTVAAYQIFAQKGVPVQLIENAPKEAAFAYLDEFFSTFEKASIGHQRAYRTWKARILEPQQSQSSAPAATLH